jgi:hypothetical protein
MPLKKVVYLYLTPQSEVEDLFQKFVSRSDVITSLFEKNQMKKLNFGRVSVIAALGLFGWALCGAIMFVGMAVLSLETTLIIHAIGAPVIFTAISWFYFKKLNYTSPLQTSVSFLLIVIFMDFFLVALIINRSMEMFQSLLGTWIPFSLIFLSTYLTGLKVESQAERPPTSH